MFDLFLTLEKQFLNRIVSNPIIYTDSLKHNRSILRNSMREALVRHYDLDNMPTIVQTFTDIVIEEVINENFGVNFI